MATALRKDAVAGLVVAGLLIPEAIAYASIAGLPASHAIIAALVGLSVYAALGNSRYAIVSPTSSSAAVLAAGLATLAAPDPATRALMAFAIVAVVGIMFIAAGILKFGYLASFVSRPVLRGFAFGLAVSIVVRQLPTIVGIKVAGSNPAAQLARFVMSESQWNIVSAVIGIVALIVLLGLRRLPAIPGAVVVMAGGVGVSFLIDLPGHHVAQIGPLALTVAIPALLTLTQDQWLALTNAALPLALIVFAEAWGTTRALALRHGDSIEPNRELVALGVANLVSGGLGGLAVGAGFSASSAGEAAGATNRATGVIAAVALIVLILLAGPLIARVPNAILAAVVIAALIHALDPQPILRLWQIDRDQVIASVAAIGVFTFGVLDGMLFAVALSVVALIRRIATPELAILGRLGDSHNYVDLVHHPEAHTDPATLIVRPGEPMFFANAERILSAVERRAADANVRFVVLSLEDSGDLDSTALDALAESASRLAANGRQLTLARLKDPLRDLLTRAGQPLVTLAINGTRSVADAVDTIHAHAALNQDNP